MDKYKLPANHELFQNQSYAELTQEMYEDLYARRLEFEDMLSSGDKDVDRDKVTEQLNALNVALGEEAYVGDTLVDQWEKDLAEGRMPDLNAKVQR